MEDTVARATTRRAFLGSLAALPLAARALAEGGAHVHSFRVLSLFHPARLVLHADRGAVALTLGGESTMLRAGAAIDLRVPASVRIAEAAEFSVEVPGKLRRPYRGTLAVDSVSEELRVIVCIERELAVASIVAAESAPGATAGALAAQAVASRSFLVGAGRVHAAAEFCDATHCQFLREPPAEGSAYFAAAERTKGMVLRYRDEGGESVVAAMYSRSCGGRTRTLGELGLPVRGYPYYAVDCAFCRAHPEAWRREVPAMQDHGERSRLAYNRIHGWSALPGPIDSVDGLAVSGRGVGHGLGMCQMGAAAMAARGAGFADILAHYYPNTVLAQA